MAIIYTENPEDELWKTLSQYTYKARIVQYMSLYHPDKTIDETFCETISSSFLQANEYFRLSKEASMQVSPLLLYYGSINLILGATCLLTGENPQINSHGMNIRLKEEEHSIGLSTIHFLDTKEGGINVFLRLLENCIDLTKLDDWSLQEILLSIPEISFEAQKCYGAANTLCYPLESIVTEDANIERVNLGEVSDSEITDILNRIIDFKKSYLPPTIMNDGKDVLVVLRHKYLQPSIAYKAFSGQTFLLGGHSKRGKLIILPQWAYMVIALYCLGSLCRYNPQKWNPFVRLDDSGEKLLVERFLGYARRVLPNIFLSKIEHTEYSFVNKKYMPENRIKTLGEHEIKELIREEFIKRGNKNDDF